jgi:hypothetical protein
MTRATNGINANFERASQSAILSTGARATLANQLKFPCSVDVAMALEELGGHVADLIEDL